MRIDRKQSNYLRSGFCWFFLMPVMLDIQQSASAQTGLRTHDPDSFVNQQRALDEKIRRDFETQFGELQRISFDWGGWYSTHLFLFDDGVESSRTLRRYDLRLWNRLTLDGGAHEFYVRGRWSLLDFNRGDSYDGDDDDIEGPNLERGIYRFDLSKARGAQSQLVSEDNLIIHVGRDLVLWGDGLTLATPLDHVAIRHISQEFEWTGLYGKSVGSTQDFDLSSTASRMRRDFFGVQLRYLGAERHRPFVYALWQRDRNREKFIRPFQRFDYDSFYVGFGATGEWRKGLRYAAEAVYETGQSFGDRQFIRENDIQAWAVRAELEYLDPGPNQTRTSIEYLFGSGDSDRKFSPTNSIGGNSGDRTDSSFIGFGYRNTGLGFAPRFSNLHMGRMGASYFPYPDHRKLELGADAFVYYKHHRDGAVSDPTADRRRGYLGSEIDVFLNWRMSADFSWTTRFGAFFPGDAFSDRTTRTFVLIGMTWSF